MAYSKTPSFDTHKQVEIPFVGNQRLTANSGLSSDYLKGFAYVNCYPRTTRQWGTDPQRVLVSRPVVTLSAVQSGTLESVFKSNLPSGTSAVGDTFYHLDTNISKNLVSNIVTGLGASVQVTACDYLAATTAYVCFVASDGSTNSTLYLYNVATAAVTNVPLGFVAAKGVPPVFIDGYLFILSQAVAGSTSSQRIYNCAVGNPSSWTIANDFIDSEMFPDNARYIAKHKNHLVVFGDNSTEFFYNNGYQIGSPLSRQASYAVNIGIAGWGSVRNQVAQIGNDLYFFATSITGEKVLAQLSNFQIEFVPDVYIQSALNRESFSNAPVLFPVNINGVQCIWIGLLKSATWPGNNINIIYNPVENVSWLWTFGTLTSGNTDISFSGSIVGIVPQNEYSFMVYGAGRNYTVSSEPNWTTERVIASYTCPLLDFENQNYKHIKWVDIQGELNVNYHTARLFWTKSQNYAMIDKGDLGTLIPEGVNRWRNLGRCRNAAFKIQITGTAPWALRKFELAYNQGSM